MRGLVRTIIADDHALVREGLKQLLSTVDELTVSGEAADGEAVHRLLKQSPADLLILDLGMPGVSGFQFIANLRAEWPELRVLVLTANVEPRSVRAALSAGANGYLTKGGDPSELIIAIDAIRRGNAYVAEEVRFAVDQHDGPNETPEPTAAIMSPAIGEPCLGRLDPAPRLFRRHLGKAGLHLADRINEGLDDRGVRAILVIGDAVLCLDGATLDFQRAQVGVRNELEIGDHADAESPFDGLPHTLPAFDLENRIDRQPRVLDRRLERASRG
jgi:DNA-binding NarL/FixJ family response regulator